MRKCGDCQLCCKLLPVVAMHKGAGVKCKHQKFGVGCKIYKKTGFPIECGVWSCGWLVEGTGTENLHRPDRSHYVIDMMMDHIDVINHMTGVVTHMPVVQIWVDPQYPDAWKDPALKEWLAKRAEQGAAALIRFNSKDSISLFAPRFCENGKWTVVGGECVRNEDREAVIQKELNDGSKDSGNQG